MRNLFVLLVCVFGLTTAQIAVAQPAPEPTVDLRGDSDDAAKDANKEAATPTPAKVAEKVTEAVTGDGVAAPGEEAGADEAIAMITQMVDAAKDGKWGIFAGFLLMFLVWLMRFPIPFVNKSILGWIPGKALPWVTMGIA